MHILSNETGTIEEWPKNIRSEIKKRYIIPYQKPVVAYGSEVWHNYTCIK